MRHQFVNSNYFKINDNGLKHTVSGRRWKYIIIFKKK